MKLIRRDPSKGYLDCWLWVPKGYVNEAAIQSALTFTFKDGYSEEETILTLWKSAPFHLLVPRAFWDPGSLPFDVVDCRPTNYAHVPFKSRIKLDHRFVNGKLEPTHDTVQRKSLTALQGAPGGVLQLACGKGKGQPLDEIVYTPTGPRQIGTLTAGDYVLGSDGGPARVLGIFPQGKRPVFLVSFSDGTRVRCDDQHLWKVKYDRRTWKVVSTNSMLGKLRSKAGWLYAVPYCKPAQFSRGASLPLHPWLLGAWLGDGSSAGTPKLHNPEKDLQQRFCKYLPWGDRGRVVTPTNRCAEVAVTGGGVTSALRSLGLYGHRSWEKFIPEAYLLAPVEERWALLAGLLDTDGSIANQNRTVEYTTTSHRLAADVTLLVQSLGGRASSVERTTTYDYEGEKKEGRLSYRIRITFPTGGVTPVTSKKHLDKWDASAGQRRYKYITGIEPIGEEETVCIKVDAKDSCYLTRDFIVTHNTPTALEKIAQDQVPALVIVDNTSLFEQWMNAVQTFLDVPGGIGSIAAGVCDWEGRGLVIATYHSIAANAEKYPEAMRRYFGNIFWDEAHHVNAPTFSKSVDLFYGNRYALTATPERADGLHVIADMHIGKVLYKDLKQMMKARFIFKWTNIALDTTDKAVMAAVCDSTGEVHLSRVTSFLGQYRPHLHMLIQDAIDAVKAGRKVLLLTNSVGEAANLMTIWTRGVNAPLYTDLQPPTLAELGETLEPVSLTRKEQVKLQKQITQLWEAVTSGRAKNTLKLQSDVDKAMTTWQRFLVGKRLTNGLERKQNAFLKELLKEPSTAGLMTFGVPSKMRQQHLNERPITFAITKYGKEGLDCEALDTVLVSTLFSSRAGLQQLMGRPTRLKPGKKSPLVVFYVPAIGQFIGMAKKLQKHLRDWAVDEGGPFEYELLHYPEVTACKIRNLAEAFGS